MKYRLMTIAVLFISVVRAQESDRLIRRGNDFYRQQQYKEAGLVYAEVLTHDPDNATAKFNQANALYRQNKPDEAIRVLNDLSFKTTDPAVKAKAFYNKAAILSAQKKLEESIEAYKDALRQDPGDKDARENLQKALLELKKKNPPKKQDKKKQQQKQQQQKPQPKMSQKEAEQRLQLLEQKEKNVQQRLQREKSKQGGGQGKDW